VFLTFDRGRVADIGFTTPYYYLRHGRVARFYFALRYVD
jgi:hypothetical protein